MSDLWDRFRLIRKQSAHLETAKDLLRQSPAIQKEYNLFRSFLRIDGRLSPSNANLEFAKYQKTALVFKSESLQYDLSKVSDVSGDKYKSGGSLAAKITDAIYREGKILKSIAIGREKIDIAYNRSGFRKIVRIELVVADFDFMHRLPITVRINIDGTSYNKNAFGFLYDYANSSSSFESNLGSAIQAQLYSLYYY